MNLKPQKIKINVNKAGHANRRRGEGGRLFWSVSNRLNPINYADLFRLKLAKNAVYATRVASLKKTLNNLWI